MRATLRTRWILLARTVCLLAAWAAGACDRQVEEAPWTSPIPFDTTFAWVHTDTDSTRLLLELAESPSQQQFGMMTRPSLDPESGMLFVYDSAQAPENGFWMYRTIVPLDIAFLDRGNMILSILSMDPCPSPNPQHCPAYPPRVSYWSALEVNRGWFARHQVGVGGVVRLESGSEPGGAAPGS
jgi:uncharacterized membrane protein (UPF0127 family)